MKMVFYLFQAAGKLVHIEPPNCVTAPSPGEWLAISRNTGDFSTAPPNTAFRTWGTTLNP